MATSLNFTQARVLIKHSPPHGSEEGRDHHAAELEPHARSCGSPEADAHFCFTALLIDLNPESNHVTSHPVSPEMILF